jgi:hypothetical protein
MSPAIATPGGIARERARAAPRRAAPAHQPRRAAPLRAPRRVSGPLPRRAGAVRAPRQTPAFGARALAIVRGLPDHSLIDRLVRGRAWIPVLGVLLAGLVAMQVEILKLGTSIGRSMERSSVLQSQDESLQASVATLSDDQRIERLAAAMGMVTPAPMSVVFLRAHRGGDTRRALANIHAPDPAGFAAQLASQAAAAAAMLPSASASASTTTASAPTTTAVPSTAATSIPSTGATSTSATPAASGASTPAASTTAPATGPPANGPAPAPSASPTSSAASPGAAGVAPPAAGQSSGG